MAPPPSGTCPTTCTGATLTVCAARDPPQAPTATATATPATALTKRERLLSLLRPVRGVRLGGRGFLSPIAGGAAVQHDTDRRRLRRAPDHDRLDLALRGQS